MIRRPFLIFLAVIVVMVTATLAAIQSPRFAAWVKHELVHRIPESWGVQLEFNRFDLRVFPPGISLLEPAVTLSEDNVAQAPSGKISAGRLSVNFYPLQMFSGRVSIHEVEIEDGQVSLDVDPKKLSSRKGKKPKSPEQSLGWDDLLQIKVDAVRIVNADLTLRIASEKVETVSMKARHFELEKWSGDGGLGYELDFDVRDLAVGGKSEKLLMRIPELAVNVEANPLGVRVGQVKLKGPGVEFNASGEFKGDPLLQRKLAGDIDLEMKGDFAQAAAWWISEIQNARLPAPSAMPAGAFAFKGKAKGDLFDLQRTLSVDGALSGQAFAWNGWNAERWSVEAAWSSHALSPAGRIHFRSAEFESPHSPRVSPHTPARGGKLKIGAFLFEPDSQASFDVPIEIQDAHIQWLLGGLPQAAFSLGLRATGSIKATITPARHDIAQSRVALEYALKMPEFALDNQKIGKNRPLKRTVVTKELSVEGKAEIQPKTGVTLSDLRVSMPNIKFIGKGRIGSGGTDIQVVGPVDLSDVRVLAESEIQGKGMVSFRVKTNESGAILDWDFDLSDAKYINLNFGDVKGKISLDEDKDYLSFENIRGKKGITAYSGEGAIDLDKDKMGFKIDVGKGDIQDLMQIFDHLVSRVSWAPKGVQGETQGTISVSGGTGSDEMIVIADLRGDDWSWASERFRKVSLHGGYDRGAFFADRVSILKQAGLLEGRVRVGADRWIEWQGSSSNLLLSDFDFFSKLDVPVRGRLNVSSRGKGKLDAVESSTTIEVTDAKLRGVSLARSFLSIEMDGKAAHWRGSLFDGQATLDASHALKPGQSSRFTVKAQKFDFTPILHAINAKLVEDPSFQGSISGDLDLRYDAGQFEKSSGTMRFQEYLLAKSGAVYRLSKPVFANIVKGTVSVDGLELVEGDRRLNLALQSNEGKLDGRIRGKTSLAFVEFLVPALSEIKGQLTTDLRIGGSILMPELFGKVRVESPSFVVGAMDTPVESLDADVKVNASLVKIERLSAELGKGRITGNGDVELFLDRAPRLSVALDLNRVRPKIYPFQYFKVSGPLTVSGTEWPYMVKGKLFCHEAFSNMAFNRKLGSVGGGQADAYLPRTGNRQEARSSVFKLDLDVSANKGLLWQNDLIDAEWKGQFRLINTFESPRVLGEANLVQGKLNFNDRQFTLNTLNVVFDNPSALTPRFTLSGNTEVRSTRVNLLAYGNIEQMKIDLSSSPPLPESEILSLLAVGTASRDFVAGNRSFDRSTLSSGEAASAILNSLNFGKGIQDKTGLKIQLDEAVNSMYGASIFRPNALADQTASPKIVIRREIGRRLNLSLGSTFGVGTNSQQELNAEYRLTPGSSMIGVWNNFEQVNTGDRQTSFGFDFRLQKRFE